ncbi:tetratricopeptide repeat protein [Sediminibacterium soli]|uniref:tetratricopeptide repeat protein n=1 Tax=Sediminibacterium soli TaxID=2698829 RepID=UPI00137B57F4|nr:tetratricopeptide repeat protein [Sediminibacterium soli]NCI46180.1 tetratricopeptide repeat protein [Sediminibacterium soli]
MKRPIHYLLLLPTMAVFSLTVKAQLTKANTDIDAEFKTAKDLYQKEAFSLAYPVFRKLYANGVAQSEIPENVRLESKYYAIVCGLQLNDSTAEPLAQEFIELENTPARIQMMAFHLAEYYYRKRDFNRAQNYFRAADIANLSNREIADMKFHQAYGYFAMQQFDKANPLFNAIRQLPKDPNYVDANYYYGFISFTEKNYSQALESFQVAEKSPEYQNVVPFYVAEIYYFNGEKDKALEYGEKAIRQSGNYYDLQLHQLVGHIWFEKKEFAKALPYLEKFVNAKEKVRREDLYELSYCYYVAKNWNKSIEGFKQLGGAQDSLAQNSMYLLADAYLKTNDKVNARSAFQFCADNNSNAAQKEVSVFNYAKLSYELGYLDVALKNFQAFLASYPKSTYLQEAKELLVNTLANTSNYREALRLYESLGAKSDNAVRLYPRLLYGASVEAINDQNVNRADSLLSKLLQVPYNTALLPLTYFWKGEIAYRNESVDPSIEFMQNYLKNPVTNGEVNPVNAKYILAYGYFRKENYDAARNYFEQVAKVVTPASAAIEQDAFLRAADCYFMRKEFAQALRMYESVISQQLPAADYALYQKAIIAGAMNRNSEKISLLQSLERSYPKSSLVTDANIEIANTYIADENFQAAIAPLKKVTGNPKAASYGPQAYLKLGVAYFNLDKNDDALENFKKLVATYPNSEESNDAIEYIRNIFVEKQQPGDFASFMRQNGKPISENEEDSLTYRAAMMRYEARDLPGARAGFAAYLAKFPQGRFHIDANYQIAEMLIAGKMNQQALPYYKAVADEAPNKYAERSTLQTARIYYFDLKDYANAEKYFSQLKNIANVQENKLEAMRGLLRCQFKTQKWKEASANAQDLLQEKGIASDDRMMANLVVAKNHQLSNEQEAAIAAYKQVIAAGKSEYAAESQYQIADILLQQNKLPDAEKAAFEMIKKMGSYDYWVTRSYILLGDVYTRQKDYFNAEATLKSVVENATITELKEEAQRKLAIVLEEKNKANKVEQ